MFINKGMKELQFDIITGALLKISNIVFGVAIIPLMLKFVDNATLGIWFTLLSILQWITMMDFGLAAGIRNRIAELRVGNHCKVILELTLSGLCTLFFIMFIACSLFAVFNYFLPLDFIFKNGLEDNTGQVKIVFLLVAIAISINVVLSLSTQVLAAYEKPIYMSLSGAITAILYFLILCVCLMLDLKGLYILAGGYIFSLLISGVISTYKMCKLLHIKREDVSFLKFDISLFKGFGVKIFLIQLAALVLFSSSRLLISYSLGPEQVVYFEVAQKIIMVGLVFHSLIMNSLWSSFTVAWYSNNLTWIVDILKKLILLMVPILVCAILYYLFADEVISLWMGDKYVSSSFLYFGFSIYFVLSCWSNIFASFVNGVGEINFQLYSACFSAIINIPISLILMSQIGLPGAIFSTCISLLPYSIVGPIEVARLIKNKEKP